MSYLSFEGFETDQILSSCSPSKFKCWQELLNNSCIHFKWKLSSNVCPVNALPYHLSCQTAWVAAFSSFHSEQEILQFQWVFTEYWKYWKLINVWRAFVWNPKVFSPSFMKMGPNVDFLLMAGFFTQNLSYCTLGFF